MVVKKLVGALLRLRLNLSGGETDRYVRAFFYGANGAPLSPASVDLSYMAAGIYGENESTMPNADHFDVEYVVYLDSDFTIEDQTYSSSVDSYERDTFDPSRLVQKPFSVLAQFSQSDAIEALVSEYQIEGQVVSKEFLTARVEQTAITVEVRGKNEVEGIADGNH